MKPIFHLLKLCGLAVAATAGAATHYVSSSGTHTAPFGTWASAATNIQAAVDVATNGALVIATNGTYVLSSQILITNAITVLAFGGAANTVVDGNFITRCFYLNHTGAAVEGFTITRGLTNSGSGAYLNPGTLRNCVVNRNSGNAPAFGAWAYGGGVWMTTGCVVEASVISSNYGHYGGGVYCAAGGTIRGCRIEDNHAGNAVSRDGAFGGYGGGVLCPNGASIERCVIVSNSADFYGGGVNSSGPSSLLSRCVIAGNSVGPYVSESIRIYPQGGGAYIGGGRIENCLIVNNLAGFEGAGLKCYATTLVQNCTIACNTSTHSSVWGCGLSTYQSTVRNCIIYLNAGDTNQPNYNTNSTDISWSCTTPLPVAGSGNSTNDPQFADSARDNFFLSPSSGCIDAGTTNNAPIVDLDGTARPLDGNADGAAAFDMGAYEFAGTNCDTDSDGQSDFAEAVAGSDGTSSSHTFSAQASCPDSDDGSQVVRWDTVAGRVYTLQTTTNLFTSWTEVPGQTHRPGNGATMCYTNPAPADGPQFYKVKVLRPR